MTRPEEIPDEPIPSEDSKDPRDRFGAEAVQERFNQGAKALTGFVHTYWANHAYIHGDQWLYFSEATRSLEAIQQDPDRVRATVNKMWPASRTIIAKATSRPLQFYVPPTGADDSTMKAARTAESILVSVARDHEWEALRESATWSAWKGGTAAIEVRWDPKAGSPVGQTDKGDDFGTGDTVEEALSIADFVIEPGAKKAETARWWIKSVAMPPEQARDVYGLSFTPKPDGTAASTPFQRRQIALHQGGDGTVTVDLTRVLTYYERPNVYSPKGRVLVVINEHVVDEKPWPFPFKDRLNIVLFRETVIDGQWAGDTILKAARPIQNAINQSWSSIIEHMKLAGNARLGVPEDMMDLIDTFTDTPGETFPFRSQTPVYVSPPTMPAWWIDEPAKLKIEMDDILGNHEVARGDAPGRVDSGLGISILVEQNDTPGGRIVKETAHAFGRLAELVLRLYEAKVTESRTSTVKTPGQPPRTARWTGKDLKGQVAAEVPLDSLMPRSKAADEARADKMVQMQLITSVADYHRVAGIPLDRDVLEALSPDVAKARRENAMMALGRPSVPAPFDDHATHIPEHLTFMKSTEWDFLSHDEQQTFLLHVQAHATLSAEELGEQAAKTATSPILGTAVSPVGAATLTPEMLAAGQPAPAAPAPAPAEEAVQLDGEGSPDPVADAVLMQAILEQSPGIDPGIVESELS